MGDIDPRSHAAFVRGGFETGALNFLSAHLRRGDAVRECLEAIGEGNAFSGAAVAAALEPLLGTFTSVQVGRDASPVLFVDVPSWTQQAIRWPSAGPNEQLDPEARRAIATSFFVAMARVRADALSAEMRCGERLTSTSWVSVTSGGSVLRMPSNPSRLRAWWD